MADQITQQTLATNPARLLRCSKTKRYWSMDGWTPDPSRATSFSDEMDAVRACVDHGLMDIELVLRIPTTGVEVFAAALR
jgi:hypothetical protein